MGKCGFIDKGDVTPAILGRLGLTFNDIYASADNAEALALAAMRDTGRNFAAMPFCHTVEAKALGGDIFPGDETAGPRAGSCIYKKASDVKIFPINDHPDIVRLAEACAKIKRKGIPVTWMMTGPMSILSCLVPMAEIFKTWRKEPDVMAGMLDSISEMLLNCASLFIESGVSSFSYADPAGELDILGPKNGAFMSEKFTAPFLKKLIALCGSSVSVTICPLTAEVLKAAGLLDELIGTPGNPLHECVKCICVKAMNASAPMAG